MRNSLTHLVEDPRAVGTTRTWVRQRQPRQERRDSSVVLPFPTRTGGAATPGTQVMASPSENGSAGTSPIYFLFRVIELTVALLYLGVANGIDWLFFGRFWPQEGSPMSGRLRRLIRRAARLRRVLQFLGGTFIKIGQQMSIRADVFPPAYCHELEKLLDNAEPIPEPYVRQVLERQTGKPLGSTFALPFNFSPFGSASVACVYRARLHSGEEVAVKIRRPRIERQFRADLAALSGLLRTAEFFTLLRPGVSTTFRSEIRLMLLEELNFHLEMRYQELFRRYFKKRKKLNTTAPKVYFHLCGAEVLVSEFITGIWMKDLIAAVETDDLPFLEELRTLNIDPKRIAKQLVRGSHYGFFECPFFHGDPHPGNIVVQPGNRIVLVDFGACGVFAQRERNHLAQMNYHQAQEDIGGMVQCVINLMEPLPPIDVEALRRGLEDAWWKGFYGIKSHHAHWRERTSFRLWTALFREVRRQRIPLPLSILRMIRATLLYDSVAARIYPRIDVFKEYRRYYEGYARRVQRQIQGAVLRQLFCGPDPVQYVRLKRLWDVGEVLLRRVQIFLQKPLPSFTALISKGYDLLITLIKWLLLSSSVTVVALVIGILVNVRQINEGHRKSAMELSVWRYPLDFYRQLQADLVSPRLQPSEILFTIWFSIMVLMFFKYVRQAWFRLYDKDVEPRRR